MKETKFYCDLCGEETKLPTVIEVKWPALGLINENRFEICDKCRKDVQKLAPMHFKNRTEMHNVAAGCIRAMIKKSKS